MHKDQERSEKQHKKRHGLANETNGAETQKQDDAKKANVSTQTVSGESHSRTLSMRRRWWCVLADPV
jgi:hypothetical protein